MLGQGDTTDLEDVVPPGISATEWVQAGLLVIGSGVLAVVIFRVIVRVVSAGSTTRLAAARMLGRLSGMALFVTGTIYALNTLGVRIAPLLGALGIVGIALAFALQDTLENFIAGIIIQSRSPFRYGDQIRSGDWEGTVEDVDFRAVVLRMVDGTRVILPSSMVLKDPIRNLTAFAHRRTTATVSVGYGTDLDTAAAVIRDATAEAPGVLADPAPEVLVEELGASGIDFAVRFWHAPSIADMWRTRDEVLRTAYEALRAAGIEIPFPQRTLSFARPSDTAEREPTTREPVDVGDG